MATIYRARHLLYGDAPPLDGGALLEQNGLIAALGSLDELKKSEPTAKIVDFDQAVLLPAFVNAHTHLELSLYPAWAKEAGASSAPGSFVDWMLRLIKVKRSLLSSEAMADAIRHGLQRCLEAGTAAVGDILSWHAGLNIYADSPLRGQIFLESLGQDPARTQQLYRQLVTTLQRPQSGNFRFAVSPHSPYTIHAEYMSQLFELCRQQQLKSSVHIAESRAEVDFLARAEGELVERLYPAVNWQKYSPKARKLSPVTYLEQLGGLFADQLLVHGVQLTAEEMQTIAKAGAHLVLCPRSNDWLQVGTAPVAELKRAGVKLALGTDSLASNQSLSLWDELSFAANAYDDVLDAAELFALATTGGASALGLQGQLGELTPGLRCSFQIVRRKEPLTDKKLLETLITEGAGQKVAALVLDGVSVL